MYKRQGEEDARWLIAARGNGYREPISVWEKASVTAPILEKIAKADAFSSLGLSRRDALWAIRPLRRRMPELPLFSVAGVREVAKELDVVLPKMTIAEEVVEDYAHLKFSLRAHPVQLLRYRLKNTIPSDCLTNTADGMKTCVAGLVIFRQRPGSAKGVVFLTLEDEKGALNIIVWPKVLKNYWNIVLTARLIMVTGTLQKKEGVINLIASRLEDISHLLDSLSSDTKFLLTFGSGDRLSKSCIN